jgi:nitroreductase
MDVYEAIHARRSVRAFQSRPVPDDLLEKLFEAVRLAPSARNRQEWRFVAVRDARLRRHIAVDAAAQPFIAEAPIVLACCGLTDSRIMRCGQPAYTIDVAIAMDHLTLVAAAEGLGTCWIGSFDEKLVKELLGIPEAVRVVQLMPLGWPSDAPPARKNRLSVREILRMEKW